jgi:hypothetical protein
MPISLSGSLIITGSMTTSGTITAQTLVVQTITSSIVNLTGSNIFGSQLTDRQTFTGSVNITGSIVQSGVNTTSSFTGNVGVGTTAPLSILDVRAGAGTAGSILNLSNTTGAAAGNIVPIRFYSGNTFGGLEQIAAIWGINPNASTNNGGALVFATSANGTATTPAERMRIINTGNVGIGITNPQTALDIINSGTYQLHVATGTGSYSDGSIYFGGLGTGDPYYYGTIGWNQGDITMRIGAQCGNGSGGITFYTSANTGAQTEKMRITSGGNITMNSVVYANTATATVRTLYIGSDYTIGGVSSIRASKTNIQNITDTNWLQNLNPVSFNYRKKNEEGNYTDEFYEDLSYGLIAEDVESVNSLLCNYDVNEDNSKKLIGIEYPRLIVPMLKAIQELSTKLDEATTRINALESR